MKSIQAKKNGESRNDVTVDSSNKFAKAPASFSTTLSQQLESHLWESANILRGPVDAADFKTYIFPLLFFKRICDVWDEECAEIVQETGDAELTLFPESHRFQIPAGRHWNDVRTVATNVGNALQRAVREIASFGYAIDSWCGKNMPYLLFPCTVRQNRALGTQGSENAVTNCHCSSLGRVMTDNCAPPLPSHGRPSGPHQSPNPSVVLVPLTLSTALSPAMAIIMMLATTPAVALAVARHVLMLVPVILHEIDRLATGVVLAAMLAPVLSVTRRYVEIDRLAYHAQGHRLDHDRLRVDQLRLREVADVDAAIEARLADLHRYTDIGGKC